MNGPAIVVVSADSPTSGKDAWVSSVHGEHWKRHADMGFSGFRHFENMPGHPDNVGDLGEPPDHLFVYELPDVTIAFGEEYRKLAASYEEEPWRDLGRGSHGVYGQIFQYPPPRDHYSFGHTGHIFFSRADCPPEYAEEYSAYYDTEHIPLVFDEIPGFVTARRFASAPEPVSVRPLVGWLQHDPPRLLRYRERGGLPEPHLPDLHADAMAGPDEGGSGCLGITASFARHIAPRRSSDAQPTLRRTWQGVRPQSRSPGMCPPGVEAR